MKTYQGTVDQTFVMKSRNTGKWPRMCSKMAEGEDDFRKYYQMPNEMLAFLDFAGGTVVRIWLPVQETSETQV